MSYVEDAQSRATGAPAGTPPPPTARRFVAERATRRGLPAGPPRRRTQSDITPNDGISGLRRIVHYAGFACRAIRRRKALIVLSFLLTFSLIAAATAVAPPSYKIEVKLLTQRSAMMTSLSNPGRAVPYDADAPTRAAAETILRRDNVISWIREIDLIDAWDRTRAPVLRVYDRSRAMLRGREPTLDEKLDDLVQQIERRMTVSTASSTDGLVTITLAWPDAHSGYLLVQHAQESFLQARQVAETQAISEALKVLQGSVITLRQDIQTTLGELRRTEARVAAEYAAAAPPPVSRLAAQGRTLDSVDRAPGMEDILVDPQALTDPRLGRLKNAVAAKHAELTRLEDEQKRQLDTLQAQLSIARAIYTPNHPTVQSLQETLLALQHRSPQVMLLRNEIDRLETAADEQAALAAERLIRATMGQRGAVGRTTPRSSFVTPAAPASVANTPDVSGRPRPSAVGEFATLRLRTQLLQLQSILERIDGARIELEVSRAAFKHRYSVVSPAEEPAKPRFPNTLGVMVAGFIASVLFALAVAVAADIAGARILEPWQVERQLGLLVLGTARTS